MKTKYSVCARFKMYLSMTNEYLTQEENLFVLRPILYPIRNKPY